MSSVKFKDDMGKRALDEALELREGMSKERNFNVPPGDALMAVIAGELKKIEAHLEALVARSEPIKPAGGV